SALSVTSRNALPWTRSGSSVPPSGLSSNMVFKLGTFIDEEILPQPFFSVVGFTGADGVSEVAVDSLSGTGLRSGDCKGCGAGILFAMATGLATGWSGSFFFTSVLAVGTKPPCLLSKIADAI